MKRKRFRIFLWLAGIALLSWLLGGFFFAWLLTAPAQKDYPPITAIDGHAVKQLSLLASDGTTINAWLAGESKEKSVILLSGIRSNSSAMKDRAAVYLKKGFSVLMPDLRGTGRSGGDAISFGWNERLDLLSCFRWLKANGYEHPAVHGCSLGAATICYSLDSVSDYRFVVVESPYDNIDHAFAHRTFDSGFNRTLFWPVYFFTEKRTGVDPDQLSPEKRVRQYKGPLLYIAGDKEKQIPVEETRRIFSEFASVKKSLHFFAGAPHCDYFSYAPDEYAQLLNNFLEGLNQAP